MVEIRREQSLDCRSSDFGQPTVVRALVNHNESGPSATAGGLGAVAGYSSPQHLCHRQQSASIVSSLSDTSPQKRRFYRKPGGKPDFGQAGPLHNRRGNAGPAAGETSHAASSSAVFRTSHVIPGTGPSRDPMIPLRPAVPDSICPLPIARSGGPSGCRVSSSGSGFPAGSGQLSHLEISRSRQPQTGPGRPHFPGGRGRESAFHRRHRGSL